MKNLRIKKYVCGTFLASALLMVGCQTDEAVDEWGEPGQQPGDAGDVTLLLSVAGRTGYPYYSSGSGKCTACDVCATVYFRWNR